MWSCVIEHHRGCPFVQTLSKVVRTNLIVLTNDSGPTSAKGTIPQACPACPRFSRALSLYGTTTMTLCSDSYLTFPLRVDLKKVWTSWTRSR